MSARNTFMSHKGDKYLKNPFMFDHAVGETESDPSLYIVDLVFLYSPCVLF